MAAHKGDIYCNVKRVGIREVKIPDKAFGMDVLCAEEEILSLFHDMSHVIIGAVPTVADEDVPGIWRRIKPVNHIAEGPEFILTVDRLDKCGRIGVLIQVIECIQVHAVEAFCGMPF